MNTRQAFEFHGEAAEYFRVWVVNLFLSIVTLGIYSAWAKVRNKQYFYGNTRVAASAFEYTADPLTILKGRILVVAVLSLFSLLAEYYPLLDAFYLPLILLILPWLVLRGLMFNARYSSYRNLHFSFTGKLLNTYAVVLILGMLTPLLIVFSAYFLWMGSRSYASDMSNMSGLVLGVTLLLFIWWVVASYYLRQYYVNNSRYGRLSFVMLASLKQFFIIFGIAAVSFSVALLLFLMTAINTAATSFQMGPGMTYSISIIFIMLLYLRAYLKVHVFNQVWNMTRLTDVQDQPPTQLLSFSAELKVNALFFIYLTNIMASAVSLGLLIPWARVRLARYQIERMTLLSHGDLDRIIADEKDKVDSFAGEMGDLLDIDIGL